MESVGPVQTNIYQSIGKSYRKDVSQLQFDNDPRAQEKLQMKDEQC